MKNKLVQFSLLLAIFGFAKAWSQPPTNEQLVIDAVKSQVDKYFDRDSSRSLLVISGQTELELLIAGAIADAMRTKYHQLMLANSPSPSADNLIFYIQGFDFRFYKGPSRGFLKAHKIKREFQGQLRIIITSGMDGQVRNVRDIPISYSDTIDPGWAKYVNSRNIPEFAPQASPSGWTRYVEPTIVIAAVGALVYLFFANR